MRIFNVLFVLMWIAGFVGWCMNIAAIVHSIADPTVTPMLIVRIVGVFAAPLGAVLGYF